MKYYYLFAIAGLPRASLWLEREMPHQAERDSEKILEIAAVEFGLKEAKTRVF